MLGAHISIAGGIYRAPARGRAIGCEAIQIFTRSNRQWAVKPLVDADREKLDAERKRTRIQTIVVHSAYLINLASGVKQIWQRSFDSWKTELERCEFLGLDRIVLHPGSHGEATPRAGLARVARGLDRAFRAVGGTVKVLLETTAGQGTNLGFKMEHLRDLIGRSSYPERLGTCLDTCHVFAAGYDLREEEAYEETLDRFDGIVGLDTIGCFHLNDSRKPLGSKIDRHANIGAGELGEQPFRRLLIDPRFVAVPMLLETPGGESVWKTELRTLKRLRASGALPHNKGALKA